MIKVYSTSRSDKRAVKAFIWLDNHNLDYEILTKNNLNDKILIKLLSLSDKGFDEILVSKTKIGENGRKFFELIDDNITTLKMIEIILKNPTVLKTPIIFDEKRYLVGYNGEEIRMFLPRTSRKITYKIINKNNSDL